MARRLRRRPNIEPTPVQCLVFVAWAATISLHSNLGGLKETKLFLPHPRVKVSIVVNLRDREVACSASDRQGSNFESCVWRTVSSQSSHHPQEVLLAQFSLYVHKGGLKPDSFHFISYTANMRPTVGLILDNRLVGWPSIEPTLDERLVFTGSYLLADVVTWHHMISGRTVHPWKHETCSQMLL